MMAAAAAGQPLACHERAVPAPAALRVRRRRRWGRARAGGRAVRACAREPYWLRSGRAPSPAERHAVRAGGDRDGGACAPFGAVCAWALAGAVAGAFKSAFAFAFAFAFGVASTFAVATAVAFAFAFTSASARTASAGVSRACVLPTTTTTTPRAASAPPSPSSAAAVAAPPPHRRVLPTRCALARSATPTVTATAATAAAAAHARGRRGERGDVLVGLVRDRVECVLGERRDADGVWAGGDAAARVGCIGVYRVFFSFLAFFLSFLLVGRSSKFEVRARTCVCVCCCSAVLSSTRRLCSVVLYRCCSLEICALSSHHGLVRNNPIIRE